MSQIPRAAARPRTPKSGSVAAARERAENGVSDASRVSPPKSSGAAKGVAISRPTPMPQWPLVANSDDARSRIPRSNNPQYNSPRTNSPRTNSPRNNSPPHEQTQGQGSPPRRPNRPSYVPSILDSSKVQDPIPVFQYSQHQDPLENDQYRPSQQTSQQRQRQAPTQQYSRPRQQQQQQQQQQYQQQQQQQQQQAKYWEQGYMSPHDVRTSTAGASGASTSSRPSTTSSVGSIPEFPIPALPSGPQSTQVQPRRSVGLGPPPTSRRGASSYYSQSSYVAPIPEESVETVRGNQHGSYASSHAIPQSWVEGSPEYYMDSYQEEDDEDEEGRASRESRSTDPDESTGLVRNASVGKQYKPTLTTVRSNENSPAVRQGPLTQTAVATAVVGGSSVAGLDKLYEANMEDEEDGMDMYRGRHPDTANASTLASGAGSEATTPSTLHDDPRVKQILGGLAKGGALDNAPAMPSMPAAKDEIASSSKQPLRLDIEAVRVAEQRGSLTSLPDLIRRATKVASNLDKGRTASRLGMLDMFGSQPDLAEKAKAANAAHNGENNQRSSSISGMLASFPPPALTPGERPSSRWPSPFDNSNPNLARNHSPLKPEGEPLPRRRRCCGMPAWVFLLLLSTLICVIAAAVIVPIVLIVLPRENAASSAADLSDCSQTNPCPNGGTSVISDNSCRCVCANGFTGSMCSIPADIDCTSVTIDNFAGATLGSALPRLISEAFPNFSIPLNTTVLLSTLSASNLSCSDENALVTFNGASQRRMMLFERASPSPSPSTAVAAITSNGILLAPNATPAPTAVTLTGSSAPTASPTASPATPTNSPSQNDLDFARVALLLILQDEGIEVAVNAQTALKPKLASGSFVATTVDVGDGIEVDLLRQRVLLNGAFIGG